ncbi:hypothetical protein [Alistipes putredinis]|uniref:hypothetical protein n=1 Tax=Alistipes putredinis TaxID=28117 RepID=UPI003F7C5297
MKFTTPCFVRVEDAEKRKELTEWLKGIGYYVCPCCLFDGWNTLHCNRIERLKTSYEVHGIPDYDRDTGYNIGWFKVDNTNEDNPSYDCGENVELFKALAAMNDENDNEQYFVTELAGSSYCVHKNRNTNLEYSLTCRKATVEEIVEYFKNNEK